MIASLINFALIIAGGCLGLLLKKGLPERISSTIMQGLALCVMLIGISGALNGENLLITIISIALGSIIGSIINLDGILNRLGKWIERKLTRSKPSDNNPEAEDTIEKKGSVAEGFVSATLLFCVGAMAIVGALQSGLSHNYQTLISKGVIDGISAIVLTSTLSWGVMLSAVPVLIYEGGITLLAGLLQPILTDTVINEVTCVGSLLIIAISLNMGITKIKVMNMLPAVIFPVFLCMIM